jgi:glycosyltransferase involved in cell wall biosynthesis
LSQDLLCFSHLRWDFVFQRPNHLMSRAARTSRVHFVEEPVADVTVPRLELVERDGVTVVIPHVRPADEVGTDQQLAALIDQLIARRGIQRPVLWYYTPMALRWTRRLHPSAAAIVYDCMDHLAGFLGAPPSLLQLERELLERADLVFTGGASLYEAKRNAHRSVHCFPSSVDVTHFATARDGIAEPDDQAGIDGPRIGFFGVLDERIDWPLIESVATGRPDWQIVLVGPVAKVDEATLPRGTNLHYLGPKPYAALPAYLRGWDVAMMPFARNEATRYISPTKTPEYLAGGRPVVSTSIRDVVTPYGEHGLVHIADAPDDFIAAAEAARATDLEDLRRRADAFLDGTSWDRTWLAMRALVDSTVAARTRRAGRPTWPVMDGVPAIATTPSIATTRSIPTGGPAGAASGTASAVSSAVAGRGK